MEYKSFFFFYQHLSILVNYQPILDISLSMHFLFYSIYLHYLCCYLMLT